MEREEHLKIDPHFYDRADAHIHLSNDQIADINPGIGFANSADMAEKRDETIGFFVEQYQIMLEENLDDYIHRFDEYRQTPGGTHPDDAT